MPDRSLTLVTVHGTSASSTTTGDLVVAVAPATAAPPVGASSVAGALLVQLDAEHPVLRGRSDLERLPATAWLADYRSPRTRRAYAGDLAGWLAGLGGDVLGARRVHVD